MWGEKRYYSLDYYLKQRFGCKVYKLSLNGGMSCPNRDGTIGFGGCIFCSPEGSGDFASSAKLSITEQIEFAKTFVAHKNPSGKYIAYFQAFTNTYAPVDYLKKIFTEAINHPDILALSIATRPDCLEADVLDLLGKLNLRKPVFIELGLQTCHEKTAVFIHRGYPISVFEKAVYALKTHGIETIVHIILGLPDETPNDILATIHYACSFPIHGLKLQLLHILEGTELAVFYRNIQENFTEDAFRKMFPMLDPGTYLSMLTECIGHIPPWLVIHRITGDGPKQLLLAPKWSSNKRQVLNTIHLELKQRNIEQGSLLPAEFIERSHPLCSQKP